LTRFIHFQTDFAQGNLQAGDFYQRLNDLPSAEKYYKRAILKDSQMVNARVNLASNLNASGKNAEALYQLETAARIQPASDHIFYTLGLLYAEMGALEKAETGFTNAIRINPNNIRASYNYALLLNQNGKAAEAEKVLKQALISDPYNGDVLNVLTIIYLQQNNRPRALETGKVLKQYHGNNPAYAQVFQTLRLP
jgi:tetratricopeptide (TPR) repeat protein